VGVLEVQRQQVPRDGQVGLVEVVVDVPPDLAVLAALLHHGVQEGQHVEARAVHGRRAGVEHALVEL